MKKTTWGMALCILALLPSLAFAKHSLFFNTGDELFEVEGAPKFENGFELGYACKHFGIFWADVWTWDCDLTAINLEEFSVADLPEEMKTDYSGKYSLSDRKRNPWNHYGIVAIATVLVGTGAFKMRS